MSSSSSSSTTTTTTSVAADAGGSGEIDTKVYAGWSTQVYNESVADDEPEEEGGQGESEDDKKKNVVFAGFVWQTPNPSIRVSRIMRPRRSLNGSKSLADVPQWALDCIDSTAWHVVRSSRQICDGLDKAFAPLPPASHPHRPFDARDSNDGRESAWMVKPVVTRDDIQASVNIALKNANVRDSEAFRCMLWPPSDDPADDGDPSYEPSPEEFRESVSIGVPPLPSPRLFAIGAYDSSVARQAAASCAVPAADGSDGKEAAAVPVLEAPPARRIAQWRLHTSMIQVAQVQPKCRLFCTATLDKKSFETVHQVSTTTAFWNDTRCFYIEENVGTLIFTLWEKRTLKRARCLGSFAIDVARLHDDRIYDEWAPLKTPAPASDRASQPVMFHFRVELSANKDFDEFDEFVIVGDENPESSPSSKNEHAMAAITTTTTTTTTSAASPSVPQPEKKEAVIPEAVSCEVCGASVMTNGDGIKLDDCGYCICKACLHFRIKDAVHDRKSDVPCPKCGKPLPQWVLKRVLPRSDFNSYLRALFNQAVADSSSALYHCPNPKCSCVLERVGRGLHPPSPTMTKQEHYDAYRMRCHVCGTVFCSACFRIPYHEGYTCIEYEDLLNSVHCRFCGGAVDSKDEKALELEVCGDSDCQEKLKTACQKKHPCGHWCNGVKDEKVCPPCLQEDCCKLTTVNASEYCPICWVEDLGSAPVVVLKCGHGMHYACILERLRLRWQGALINFAFIHCPTCQAVVSHPLLDDIIKPFLQLKDLVEAKALERFESEFPDEHKCKELNDPQSPYYHNKAKYATHKYLYSQCYRCKQPYFAGMRQCQDAASLANEPDKAFDEKELLCYSCSPHAAGSVCPIHGAEYIQYKCRYCCGVASWNCGRNLGHFCDACHVKQCSGDYLNRKPLLDLPMCPAHTIIINPAVDGKPQQMQIQQCDPKLCPLGIAHQPNGSKVDTPIGCFMCKQLHSF